MALINSFVNFKEYSNALGYNIDDGNYWDLVPGYDKKTDIFVQRNYGNFLDGIMVYQYLTTILKYKMKEEIIENGEFLNFSRLGLVY